MPGKLPTMKRRRGRNSGRDSFVLIGSGRVEIGTPSEIPTFLNDIPPFIAEIPGRVTSDLQCQSGSVPNSKPETKQASIPTDEDWSETEFGSHTSANVSTSGDNPTISSDLQKGQFFAENSKKNEREDIDWDDEYPMLEMPHQQKLVANSSYEASGQSNSSLNRPPPEMNGDDTPVYKKNEPVNGSPKLQKEAGNSKKDLNDEFSDPTVAPPPGIVAVDCSKRKTFIDVTIFNVAGPHNFYVKDYRQAKKLEELEKDMANFHSVKAFLKVDEIVPNGYYAAEVATDKWVRVKVSQIHDESSISVYCLDHGTYTTISLDQLRKLRKIETKLSVQAYLAKLAEYKTDAPNQEVCADFQSNWKDKDLIALVSDETEDRILMTKIYSVILVDTSGPKDVYIHQTYLHKK